MKRQLVDIETKYFRFHESNKKIYKIPFKKWIAGAISYFIITSDLYLNDFIYELIETGNVKSSKYI